MMSWAFKDSSGAALGSVTLQPKCTWAVGTFPGDSEWVALDGPLSSHEVTKATLWRQRAARRDYHPATARCPNMSGLPNSISAEINFTNLQIL